MFDGLPESRYNQNRKIQVDFSGFGHLFATWLSCDSHVAFLLSAFGMPMEWRMVLWTMTSCLLSRRVAP